MQAAVPGCSQESVQQAISRWLARPVPFGSGPERDRPSFPLAQLSSPVPDIEVSRLVL